MAFPVVLQGPDTEHRNDYAATDQRWQLGQKLVTTDGRAYRFSLVGASTLVVGNVLDGPALITNHLATAAVARAAGATDIAATLGATASAKNQYRGGFASIVLTPGGGETYILQQGLNITTHEAVASAGVITATLAPGETIVTALTTTSDVTWVLNPYAGVIQSPITTLTSQPAGIAVKASTTGRFGWIQTRGVATVLVEGTAVVGNRAIRLPAAAATAGPEAETSGVGAYIGNVLSVGSTWTILDLMLDG